MVRSFASAAIVTGILFATSVTQAAQTVCQLPKTGTVIIEYRKDTLANVTFGGQKHVYSSGSYFIQPYEDDSLPTFFVKGKELHRADDNANVVEKGRCK